MKKAVAIEPQEFVHLSKTCTKCGSINNCKYRYLNNGKKDQPRYQCLACKAFFSHVLHGRPKGKKYLKPRGVDPPELLGIDKTCTRCNAVNKAKFLYYNNKSRSQPRYQCLECHQEFQLRPNMQALLGSDQRDDTPKYADMKPEVTGEPDNALNRDGFDNHMLADEVRNPSQAAETSNDAQAGGLDIPSQIEEVGSPMQQTDDSGNPMHVDEANDPELTDECLNGLLEDEFEDFICSFLGNESVQAEEGAGYWAAPPAPIGDHAEDQVEGDGEGGSTMHEGKGAMADSRDHGGNQACVENAHRSFSTDFGVVELFWNAPLLQSPSDISCILGIVA